MPVPTFLTLLKELELIKALIKHGASWRLVNNLAYKQE
jgi:hypothetical protein